MIDDTIRNMIIPIEDQMAPLVLWLNQNHVCYNQNAPLAL
jgi:hypothetical protein